MDFILKEVPICADKEFEMIKITDDVRKVVEESGVEKGIVYVITEHTTTGITVNESLPCVEKDLMELTGSRLKIIRIIIIITFRLTERSEETRPDI